MANDWYDADEWTPHAICEIEMSDGDTCEARFVCGDWETKQGEVVYPVRFRVLRVDVSRGLYSFTVDGEGE